MAIEMQWISCSGGTFFGNFPLLENVPLTVLTRIPLTLKFSWGLVREGTVFFHFL